MTETFLDPALLSSVPQTLVPAWPSQVGSGRFSSWCFSLCLLAASKRLLAAGPFCFWVLSSQLEHPVPKDPPVCAPTEPRGRYGRSSCLDLNLTPSLATDLSLIPLPASGSSPLGHVLAFRFLLSFSLTFLFYYPSGWWRFFSHYQPRRLPLFPARAPWG